MSKKDSKREVYPYLKQFVHLVLSRLHTNAREIKFILQIGSDSLNRIYHGTDTLVSHYVRFFMLSLDWLDYHIDFASFLQTLAKMLQEKQNLAIGISNHRTGEITEWRTIVSKNK